MTKPNLLLLHGALGAKSQFNELLPFIEGSFNVYSIDFEGHGKRFFNDRSFRIENFCENIEQFLNEKKIKKTHIFGYSMGGYVAIYFAYLHPGMVESILTLGTKFHWTPAVVEKEQKWLKPDSIKEKHPRMVEALEKRHKAESWEDLANKTAELFNHLGRDNLIKKIPLDELNVRIRIGIGDMDNMVTNKESMEIYRKLPNGELQVFPNMAHQIEMINFNQLSKIFLNYFLTD